MLEIDKALTVILPAAVRVPIHYLVQRYSGRCDPMVKRLSGLVARHGRAIDVGANHGMYTFALSRLSTFVEAFEPQPYCVRRLEAFARVFARNVTVHPVGLSDSAKDMNLKVPVVAGRLGEIALTGRASFDLDFPGSRTIPVETRTLDDYGFDDVTFVKVDVEGHESQVIEGARATLTRCRPTMLVEIEQRHLSERSIGDSFRQILDLEYEATFFFQGRELPLSEFSVEKHQQFQADRLEADVVKERYVNNFIFRPSVRTRKATS